MQADLAALVAPVVIRGLLPVTLILGVPLEVNPMPMLQRHLLLVQTHQLGVDVEGIATEGEDGLPYLELKTRCLVFMRDPNCFRGCNVM